MGRDTKLSDQESSRLLAQLETERALLEAVLKQMPAGVVIAEAPNGKIFMGNRQVEEILRHPFTPVDEIKQYEKPYACYDCEGRPYESERMPLARALVTGEVVTEEEIYFERGDGSMGCVLLSSTPVKDREGKIVAAVAVFHDITEERQAAEDLKQSQERYRELFENANDIVYTLDLEGNLTSLNKSGEHISGYAREELIGRSIAQIVSPEYLDAMREMMARKLTGEPKTTYELEIIAKDGRRLLLEVSSRLIYEQNRAVGIQGIARDITGRKQAEAALRQSEERFAKAFEASPLALTITSLVTGRLLEVNETFERVSGYTREEAVGRTTLELGLWAEPTDREAELAMVAERGQVRNVEYRFRMKDGTIVIGLLSAEQLEIGGEPCALTVIEDITERKRAEEALRHSEERFKKAFSASPHLMTISTLDEGRYLDVNDAVLRSLGYAREEIIGRTASELNIYFDPDGRAPLLQAFKDHGSIRELEIRFRTKENLPVTVLLSAEIITLNGEKCILTTSNDITERKLAQEQLRQSEERFKKAFSASPHPMTISTLAGGRYLDVNDALLKIVGYTREELIGRTALELNAYADPSDHQKLRAALARADSVRDLEIRFRTKEGLIRVFSVSAEIITLNGERCILTASNDITERKRIEEERAELLAREQEARRQAEAANRTKDEFLATVSHELRTPLNAILGWAEMLRTGKVDQSLATRALDTIVRNARAQAQLIEDILDVSRIITGKLRLDVQPVELIPIINAAIDAVRPAVFAKGIHLDVSLDPEVGAVTGDAGRLQQIVWNLVSNAIKFTPAGGRVTLRLEQEGGSVKITVADTGVGINEEFLPHVFDRFRQADSSYTRRHGGLGLGLAIVRHLVEMHGGTVEAQSEGEMRGATFIVSLPFVKDEGERRKDEIMEKLYGAVSIAQPSAFRLHPSLDGLRALVVDDEADARDLIKVTLEQHGARVTTTASAAEALFALSERGPDDQFHLILSDIGMPDEDGLSLINKLRKIDSCEALPAIALTAYARDEDRARAMLAGFDLHIAKPFTPSELAEAVASLARKIKQDFGK